MNNVYQVINNEGRIRIPKSICEKCGLAVGDVVKIDTVNHSIVIYKVGIVDNTNATFDEVMSVTENALNALDSAGKMELLKQLTEHIRGENREK